MNMQDEYIKESIEPYLGKNIRQIALEAGINPGNFNVAWKECKFTNTMKILLTEWIAKQK